MNLNLISTVSNEPLKRRFIEILWEGSWDGSLVIRVSVWTLGLLVLAVLGLWLLRRKVLKDEFCTDSLVISYGPSIKQTVKQNHDTVKLAHQAYVELRTRKIGLRIDPDNDVLVEVYDSWYAAFKEIRELVKELPAYHLRKCGDTRRLSELLIDVLNTGLRPHLSTWQARFRRWYESELNIEPNKSLAPQDIQKNFPKFEELMTDLNKVNEQFLDFTAELELLAHKKKPKKLIKNKTEN